MTPRLAVVHEWVAARTGSEKVFEALARLHPDADLWALVRGHRLVREPQPERHGVGRSIGAHHHGIADPLDELGPSITRERARRLVERVGQIGGLEVPMRLGQRGEAREVSEQECWREHIDHASARPFSGRPVGRCGT